MNDDIFPADDFTSFFMDNYLNRVRLKTTLTQYSKYEHMGYTQEEVEKIYNEIIDDIDSRGFITYSIASNNFLSKVNSTSMRTGTYLTLGADPTNNMHAATKQYVDSNYMAKGIDYVTAGKKSGTTLGGSATAEGAETTASGTVSHAEGNYTTSSGYASHAEGSGTTASGNYSHAEGLGTTASADDSHSEGNFTTASGSPSHAEGLYTTASGVCSHAEGNNTTASGQYAHAEGRSTTAQTLSQHVFGEYNVLDAAGSTATRGTYVEIVGNGSTLDARSNARTLDWSGNEWLAGKLTVGVDPVNNMDVTTKQYVDNNLPNVLKFYYTTTSSSDAYLPDTRLPYKVDLPNDWENLIVPSIRWGDNIVGDNIVPIDHMDINLQSFVAGNRYKYNSNGISQDVTGTISGYELFISNRSDSLIIDSTDGSIIYTTTL